MEQLANSGVTCQECGYDLRGCRSATCPECGFLNSGTRRRSKRWLIPFLLLESSFVVAGILSVSYWRDCFIWGHFCTHSIIEVVQKLYCGIAGPMALLLPLVYRPFQRLFHWTQWSFATIGLTLLAIYGALYAMGYGW